MGLLVRYVRYNHLVAMITTQKSTMYVSVLYNVHFIEV